MGLIPETRAYTLRSDEDFKFGDDFANDLIKKPSMQRLKDIGFLGAIDYVKNGNGREAHRRKHNRYEHSLGVAKLAELYAIKKKLPIQQRRLLLAAAFLHDIGHGPLSHSLEPVFESEFSINHHIITNSIIRGDNFLGGDVKATLDKYSIDPEEVISLIEGKYDAEFNFLFSSPINIDTLEGIHRCKAFFGSKHTISGQAQGIVAVFLDSILPPIDMFDAFWELKDKIYNLCIRANIGLELDSIAQMYMRDNISQFSEGDFLLTERQFWRKHKEMFSMLLATLNKGHERDIRKLSRSWLDESLEVTRRSFTVVDVRPDSLDKMHLRYKQRKTVGNVPLREIAGRDY